MDFVCKCELVCVRIIGLHKCKFSLRTTGLPVFFSVPLPIITESGLFPSTCDYSKANITFGRILFLVVFFFHNFLLLL